ncbi:MAG: hypothetical protein F6K19_51410 [Cyanothece sp. SIO1E1]|nr:hypothetical protein [Cyanothece sp. SIO1E1]
MVQPNGNVRWMIETGTPSFNDEGEVVQMYVTIRDITDRLKLERQNRNAQRLESIGQLAGGVAHDLNNTLAPILLATKSLQKKFPETREIVDTMEKSAKRGADLVRQLLHFAKGGSGVFVGIESSDLLNDAKKLIPRMMPKHIDFRVSAAENLWSIRGDMTQLFQVILNLSMNASDAMPDGGVLSIVGENVDVDESY